MNYIIRNKKKLLKEIKDVCDNFYILKNYSWDHKLRLFVRLKNKILRENRIA